MSWTPGPWRVETRTTSLFPELTKPFHQVLAGEQGLGVYPHEEADARLIAAAPEMAALLEAWVTGVADGTQLGQQQGDSIALLSRIQGVPAPASPSLTDGERGSGP